MDGFTIAERDDEPRTSTGHRYCACRCGAVVESLSRTVRYASAECAERARVARAAVRSERAYAADKRLLNLRRQLRAAGALTPAAVARLEVLRGRGDIDPAEARRLVGMPPARPRRIDAGWSRAAPSPAGHVPGCGPCRIDIAPVARVAQRGLAGLHGLLSAIDGRAHSESAPRWSLTPCEGGCGWAVVWRDEEGAQHRATITPGVLYGARVEALVSSGRGRIAWPTVRRGRSRVELSTLTPVSIRRSTDRGRATYTEPTAEALTSALAQLAAWLGVAVPRDHLRCELVSVESDAASARVGPRIKGRVEGWEGRVTLDANAPARWLLEVAAAGWGLGGKTAFGFGAVRVREVA
jgi:hypothetical protein